VPLIASNHHHDYDDDGLPTKTLGAHWRRRCLLITSPGGDDSDVRPIDTTAGCLTIDGSGDPSGA
jgi:hypothetical protein